MFCNSCYLNMCKRASKTLELSNLSYCGVKIIWGYSLIAYKTLRRTPASIYYSCIENMTFAWVASFCLTSFRSSGRNLSLGLLNYYSTYDNFCLSVLDSYLVLRQGFERREPVGGCRDGALLVSGADNRTSSMGRGRNGYLRL